MSDVLIRGVGSLASRGVYAGPGALAAWYEWPPRMEPAVVYWPDPDPDLSIPRMGAYTIDFPFAGDGVGVTLAANVLNSVRGVDMEYIGVRRMVRGVGARQYAARDGLATCTVRLAIDAPEAPATVPGPYDGGDPTLINGVSVARYGFTTLAVEGAGGPIEFRENTSYSGQYYANPVIAMQPVPGAQKVNITLHGAAPCDEGGLYAALMAPGWLAVHAGGVGMLCYYLRAATQWRTPEAVVIRIVLIKK